MSPQTKVMTEDGIDDTTEGSRSTIEACGWRLAGKANRTEPLYLRAWKSWEELLRDLNRDHQN
jgi:hypothetical protein